MKPSPIADAYVAPGDAQKAQPSFPLDLYLCRGCGHVQLLDVVNPVVLFSDYIYKTAKSPSLVDHFRNYANELVNRIPPPTSGLAIDIGSNDGTFLRFIRSRGLRVLGIDPAKDIAASASESGIETLPEFFTSSLGREIRQEYGPATFVTANNVFAHADNLGDIANGIREMLAPDGVFVFEVSYLVDIVDKLLFDTVYHEHLSYHSIAPLAAFFVRHGLELFDVKRLESKGGSIQGWVQLAKGSVAQMPIIGQLLTLENEMGLAELGAFHEFSDKISRARKELRHLLERVCAAGPIPGYGASATVTTLIYNLELDSFLRCLVDDDPSRHGFVSPGLHLPVVGPQMLNDHKADFILVLAWQYADPIVKRNYDYVRHGGHFIVPLPLPTVV